MLKKIFTLLALLYAAVAIFSAWHVITATEASTRAFEEILSRYNLQNEAAQSLDRFSKQHPIFGTLLSSPIKRNLELPSDEESAKALNSDVAHFLKTVRKEFAVAAWWSWFLLNFSLFYAVTVIALSRSFTARSVLFALTCISLVFFVIGVIAPAMVIWTAPNIPLESGSLNFVLQYEVRGIAAIIWELLTGDHWVIGGFLLLFSIVTPLTKALLTFFLTASRSVALNFKIGRLLHSIGKWSMADVYVAGILLSLYALKFQQATQSIACLGLYYFLGYCLFSMATTELLVHSAAVDGKAERKLGRRAVGALFAGLLFFVLASSVYTYREYTVKSREHLKASRAPENLNKYDLPAPR